MASVLSLTGVLRLRYEVKYVSYSNFKSTINKLRGQEDSIGNKLMAVVTFARDDEESVQIGKVIKEAIADGSYHIVFIDASITPLGNDLLDQYADAMANSIVNLKQDRSLANQYDNNAKDVLKNGAERSHQGSSWSIRRTSLLVSVLLPLISLLSTFCY